jgi:hypothetical protein
MAGGYLRALAAEASDKPIVFYVDNHLRPYTGKHVIRRGWRMQDRRVLPGATDGYVHDVDGRPVLRFVCPQHDSLTSVLQQVRDLLRRALGPEAKILLAFDRGGSFAAAMAELREEGFEFVTPRERRPYPLLAQNAFEHEMVRGKKHIRYTEAPRKNLREGRGRVRRIAIHEEGKGQINLLAVSDQPAEWLIDAMRGRWQQENGFKHGVERWGS